MTQTRLTTNLLIDSKVIDFKIVGGRTYLILEKIINSESFYHEIELRHRPVFDEI